MEGEGLLKKHYSGILLPKNDVIFKNIFSKVGNENMLKELLEEITKVKIYDIQVEKEVELSQMKVGEKYGKLDLRAVINGNCIVIIEMQMEDNCNIGKRTTFYASKVIGGSLATSQTYQEIKDVHIISILNYNITPLDKYYSDTVTVDSECRTYELVEGLTYHFIELSKFRKMVKCPETKLQQWLAFIDYTNKEMVKMAMEKNELVKKAHKDYEYLTGDAALRRLQELREKAIWDENSAYATGLERGEKKGTAIGMAMGEARGEARGKKKGIIETAKAMMQNNVKREIISKCTGLSNKELDKISRSLLKPVS